ncbi:hypothetical protein PI124_g18487 [Phytophthora idaei]|nr:hypothetical protein PI126_g6062 [Phytophthora idaei]KAG3236509.1 hypothetical protein PI124_g18487 [Phytophthora idaei]
MNQPVDQPFPSLQRPSIPTLVSGQVPPPTNQVAFLGHYSQVAMLNPVQGIVSGGTVLPVAQ